MRKNLAVVLLAILICWFIWPVSCIVLEDANTGQLLYAQSMRAEDELTIGWIHSVELLPWEEVFRIKDGTLYLDRTRFKTYGAGVPAETAGKSKMENGWIVYYDLNQYMPELTYSISKRGRHVLTDKRQTIALHEALPDATPVRVSARELRRFSLLQLLLLPKLYAENAS